jgi:hypothetical protein
MKASKSLLLLFTILTFVAIPVRSQPVNIFHLSSFEGATNGTFGFNIFGPLGRTCIIDVSTDFTSWEPVITNTVAKGFSSYIEPNTSQFLHRFYRARLFWTAIVPNTYSSWLTTNSGNGRLLIFPAGWNTATGADGRTIAYPPGWKTAQGSDGRIIAYPSAYAFTTAQGTDGRVVAYPSTGFSTLQGDDGRIIAFPSSSWTTSEGHDGRLVVFPSTGFSTTQGSDGRIVAFPLTGWTTNRGADARVISYPSSECATNQGFDGRTIAFSSSGWASLQGSDGRQISYPTSTNATMDLDFQNQSLFAVLGFLQPVLSQTDFRDYVVYTFFGTGNQQFSD